jgi:hypothetical protein
MEKGKIIIPPPPHYSLRNKSEEFPIGGKQAREPTSRPEKSFTNGQA